MAVLVIMLHDHTAGLICPVEVGIRIGLDGCDHERVSVHRFNDIVCDLFRCAACGVINHKVIGIIIIRGVVQHFTFHQAEVEYVPSTVIVHIIRLSCQILSCRFCKQEVLQIAGILNGVGVLACVSLD